MDTKGVVYAGRRGEHEPVQGALRRAPPTSAPSRTRVRGADVFLGLSGKDLLTPAMLLTMAERPVVFACANPDPEIRYEMARETRPDVDRRAPGAATIPTRSTTCSGFPFIFRGRAGRARPRDQRPDEARRRAGPGGARPRRGARVHAGGIRSSAPSASGPDYLIPKPLDPRILFWEAPAVARAAMETGVARKQVDLAEYPA